MSTAILQNSLDLLDIAKDEINFFERATLGFWIECENDGAKSVCDDEENLDRSAISAKGNFGRCFQSSRNIASQSWQERWESIVSKTPWSVYELQSCPKLSTLQ